MAEAKGGARWGGQMRRRMNGGYNLVLAVIAPEDWAAEGAEAVANGCKHTKSPDLSRC